MPRHNETTIEQEIIDHGLDRVLGFGRGVLNIEGLAGEVKRLPSEELNMSEDWRYGEVFNSLHRLDVDIESDTSSLIDALNSDRPSMKAILNGLKECSVLDGVSTLLDIGTDQQREYLIGRLMVYEGYVVDGKPYSGGYYDDDDNYIKTTEYDQVAPEDIRVGLWRDVVHSSILGTPEMGALSIARNMLRPDDGKAPSIVYLHGYDSGIIPATIKRNDDGEVIGRRPATVGDDLPALAKTYNRIETRLQGKHPEYSEEDVEYKAVRDLARTIAKSTEYNPPYRGPESPYTGSFEEAMAWAQLGDQAQRQLRGMRQKIMGVDLHSIGRFIGKSGDNRYEKDWRKIEQFAESHGSHNPESVRQYYKERAQEEIARQHAMRGNEDAGTIITDGASAINTIDALSDDELIEQFTTEREVLKRKRDSHMSLAQRAVQLHFDLKELNGDMDDPESQRYVIDWINDAPFGLIKRTSTMLSRGVSKEVAFAYATAEYAFPGVPMTHELVKACEGVTSTALDRIRALNKYIQQERSEVISLSVEERVILGKLSTRYDATDVIALTAQGYTTEQVERNPWLCQLEVSQPIDFPADGTESQQQKWLAEHSYTYLAGGWSKAAVGKLIKTRLDTGIEASVHDASQWLSAFHMPTAAYDAQKISTLAHEGKVDLGKIGREKLRDEDVERRFIAQLLYSDKALRERLNYGMQHTMAVSDRLEAVFIMDPKLKGEFNKQLGMTMQRSAETFYDTILDEDTSLRSEYEAYIANGGTRKKYFAELAKSRSDIKQRLEVTRKEGRNEFDNNFYTVVIAEHPEYALGDSEGSFHGEDWFFSPEYQFLYRAAVEPVNGVPRYKTDDFTIDSIAERAAELVLAYEDAGFGTAKDETDHGISADKIRYSLQGALGYLHQVDREGSISDTAAELKAMSRARGEYIRDAQGWLSRHATSPSTRLTKVWGDRAAALAEGVSDSARSIEQWQADNAMRVHLADLELAGAMPHNLTADEVIRDWRSWTTELSRVSDSGSIIDTISEYKRRRNMEAILPAATIDIHADNGVYKAEILAKDDPRGCTIGSDTGCCMTLYGASSDCIWSGYTHPDAGFFALYTPQGQLAAQSYFYVNPASPEILVLDNIEANRGRDTNKIVKLYQESLQEYLTDRFREDPNWKIRTVNVGIGYGEAVKASVLQLPQPARVVPNAHHIYTDASEQRQLLTLSDDQITKVVPAPREKEAPEKVRPQHVPEIVTHTIEVKDAEIISELEVQIYPDHIQYYRDRNKAREDASEPGADKFSFLVSAEADSSKDYIGYCVAYFNALHDEGDGSTEYDYSELYVADMAILPDFQGKGVGFKMFTELLGRAKEHNINRILFEARESTSYAALMGSSYTRRVLHDYGYRLVDNGSDDYFEDDDGNVERLFNITIEKL